jgi:hypothetical protein
MRAGSVSSCSTGVPSADGTGLDLDTYLLFGFGDRPYTSISAGIGRYEIFMGDSVFDTRARLKVNWDAPSASELHV